MKDNHPSFLQYERFRISIQAIRKIYNIFYTKYSNIIAYIPKRCIFAISINKKKALFKLTQ